MIVPQWQSRILFDFLDGGHCQCLCRTCLTSLVDNVMAGQHRNFPCFRSLKSFRIFLLLLLASITGGLLSLYVDFRAVSTVLYGEPGAAMFTANFSTAITPDHRLNAHTLEAPSFGESSHTLKWLNDALNSLRAYMIEHWANTIFAISKLSLRLWSDHIWNDQISFHISLY